MIKSPLISIIIPAYNSERYIRRTLNTILKYPLDCELIIVDDGSIDDTLRILKSYETKYKNIKVFEKLNGGVSSARNLGLVNANGEYILFLDADDSLTKNISIAENIIKNNKVDVIRFDYEAQRIFKFLFKYNACLENVQEGFVGLEDIRTKILQTTKFNSVCFQLVRRDIIKNIRFDEKYTMAEDLDFNLKLYDRVNWIYYLPKPIIKYMYNGHSATRMINQDKYERQFSNIVEVYNKLYIYRNKWKVNVDDKNIALHIENICELYHKYNGNRRGE